jgi:hypothetical protein
MMTTKQSLMNEADLNLRAMASSLKRLLDMENPEDTGCATQDLLVTLEKTRDKLRALRAMVRQDEHIETKWWRK